MSVNDSEKKVDADVVKSPLKTLSEVAGQTAKKPFSTMSVQSVIKSNLLFLDDIRAESGMVVGQDKAGKKVVMRPEEALHKAREINLLYTTGPDERRKHELIEKIIIAARKALYHLEDNHGSQHKSAKLVRNMADGKAPDGRDILTTGRFDDHVSFYVDICPHLKDFEIAAVLRSPEIDAQKAHTLLLGMEKIRAIEQNHVPGKLD
jgi:hypothetical protein